MMVKVGLISKIEDALKTINVEYDIFDGVEMNPSLESVKRALDQVIDFSPEIIIAVGGGSTLDSAKAVRYFFKKNRNGYSNNSCPNYKWNRFEK